MYRLMTHGDPPRILVAEDDDSLRRLLELRLASDGFDVRCAEDGMEALEIVIKGWLPDAVVCDVMMPRLSGLSVGRELPAQVRVLRRGHSNGHGSRRDHIHGQAIRVCASAQDALVVGRARTNGQCSI